MEKTTKGKIIHCAWELFYEKGYDNTTVDEIIEKTNTSKGSFYYYFKAKDELLSTLSYIFDDKYEELEAIIEPKMNSYKKLLTLNEYLFQMIDHSVSVDIIAYLYSSQMVTKGERNLLDESRYYYQLINKIVKEGQSRGQIVEDISAKEIAMSFAMIERAFIYDWCIHNGSYSLAEYSKKMMPLLFGAFCA